MGVAAKKSVARSFMTSILRRPLDLVIVLNIFFFFLVAITIDLTQSIYGPIGSMKDVEGFWPPPQILKAYAWWAKKYDPLLSNNPMWFETMAWFSPFLYAPLYVFIMYAFIFEKEWIRIPVLMWGYGLLLMMFVVVREQLFGQYAAPDPLIFALAYGAYIATPLLMMLRVAWTPVFYKHKPHLE